MWYYYLLIIFLLLLFMEPYINKKNININKKEDNKLRCKICYRDLYYGNLYNKDHQYCSEICFQKYISNNNINSPLVICIIKK